MNGKSFFILLLTLGWFFVCQKWYCCWMQTACPTCLDQPMNPHAIGFLPDSVHPDTSHLWTNFIQELKGEKGENNRLEVSGRYFPQKEFGQNKGLQRAKNTKLLLQEFFPNDSIICRNQAIRFSEKNGYGYQSLVDIQWISFEEPVPNKLTLLLGRDFSLPMLTNLEDERLSELVYYSKKRNKKIKIDGHSSPTGGEDMNKLFSHKRALLFKDLLIKNGMAHDQVITEGHGSSKVLFADDVERNKRVEISILN